MVDLSNITGILKDAYSSLEGTKQGMVDAYGSAKSAAGTIGAAEALAKQQEAIIALQKDTGEYRAQQNLRAFATAAGTNMDDPSEIVSALGAQMRQSALQTLQAQQRVNKIEANNDLFSNPLGFLVDFAVGDQARGQLAASQATLESTANSLSKLNQATQSTAVTQNAIAETMSAATIQAHQQQLAAEATAAAARGRMSMAQQDINMLNTLSSLDSKGVSYAWQAYQVARSEEARIRQEAADQEAKTDAQTTINQISAGLQDFGLPPVTTAGEVKGLPKELAALAAGRGREVLYAQSVGAPVPKMTWGSNPIEAINNKRAIGAQPTAAEVDTARKIAAAAAGWQSVENLTQMYMDTGVASKKASALQMANTVLAGTKDIKEEARNQYMQYTIDKLSGDQFNWQTENNPYIPVITSSSSDKLISSSPFLSEFVAPIMDTAKSTGAVPNVTPQYLMDALLTAATRKDNPIPTNSAAADIAALYQQLIITNNSARNFSGMGMPDGDKYGAQIVYGNKATLINMASVEDVLRAAAMGLDNVRQKTEFTDFLKRAAETNRGYNPYHSGQ